MIQNRATLQQIRFYLHDEIRKMYPEGESASIARLILDHVGYPTSVFLSDPDQVLEPASVSQINEIVSEIHTWKPIQYILGYAHFCELEISVNENVLIPRPETEELVYKIISHFTQSPDRILDIGTGSGCIALALKKHFPKTEAYGLDVSYDALKVAADNSRKIGLEVNWIQGDIFNKATRYGAKQFDLIVSNPPYVLNSERTRMNINVLDFEPDGALFVEDSDPMVFYDKIASISMKHLNENGMVWVEINEQCGVETALIFETAGFQQVTILKDIHEKERFIRARK